MRWPSERSDFVPAVRMPQDLGDALYFAFEGERILSLAGDVGHGLWRPLDAGEFRFLDGDILSEHYLGLHLGRHCLAAEVRLRSPGQQGLALHSLRELFDRMEPAHFSLAGRAFQVLRWRQDHNFCGRCGAEMEYHRSDRAMECSRCGLVSYPRLSPSVIVLVRRGERALLARNSSWPPGFYSTLAGFVEPGESVEEGLHREVREEVGILIRDVRYLGSQSWPFPHSLMLGFHAEYESGELHFQDGEIAEAQWFEADSLPRMPPSSSISRWLIDDWLKSL